MSPQPCGRDEGMPQAPDRSGCPTSHQRGAKPVHRRARHRQPHSCRLLTNQVPATDVTPPGRRPLRRAHTPGLTARTPLITATNRPLTASRSTGMRFLAPVDDRDAMPNRASGNVHARGHQGVIEVPFSHARDREHSIHSHQPVRRVTPRSTDPRYLAGRSSASRRSERPGAGGIRKRRRITRRHASSNAGLMALRRRHECDRHCP
jgi:hypothetical protein